MKINKLLTTVLLINSTTIYAGLNDTGITTCSNETQNGLPCPVAGFPGQDAEYGTNSFDFTKLDANGNAMAVTATNHSCVKDNVTGLIWEVKTDDGGLRDKDNTYTFDQAAIFAANVNATNLCGHNDWRVPDIKELASIVDYSISGPSIDEDFFPNTQVVGFWSASPYAYVTDLAWIVHFDNGDDAYGSRTFTLRARLVCAGQSLSFVFTDNANGTITDNITGLIWAKCPLGQSGTNCEIGSASRLTWVQALNAAKDSTLAGRNDWRVPNIQELRSIVDYTKYNPSINSIYFPHTPEARFWSASPLAVSTVYTWIVDFNDGSDGYYLRSSAYRARLVCAGQVLPFALSVAKAGNGAGSISSNPAGINCGNVCAANFAQNSSVTLTDAPAAGSVFAGWSGDADCSDGTVTMNANKNCTATFNLAVTAPTVTTTAAATNITPTTATLNGSVSSNGATATVNFNFGTTTAYGQTIAAVPSQINSNTPVAITGAATGLICNTTYHYNITAVNSAGTTTGTDQSFITATCTGSTVNPPTVVTGNATNVTVTTATLNGTVTPNGATTTVTFDFGLTTNYDSIIAAPSIDATAGATLVSANKTDLTCNTTYHYRINAVNRAGTILGTNQNFTTNRCTTNTQANLESPQQGSYESGIGLIRGWACQANIIEIQIDGGSKYKVAYGTNRGDTQETCGHSATGFGFTYNWNSLSNGTHNLKVFADNVQFADVNFTTTNLGTSYLTGASGQHTVNNFPAAGKTATLKWSEPHQNFVITSATRTASKIMPPVIRTGITGNLESPQQNSFESGIGLIRGWVCQANAIELQIDNGTRRPVAYGTARGDTATACNGNPNTGFGYVYNWNALGDGNHNLRLFVDNQEFTNVNFTVTTLGGNYLTDLSRDEAFNFNGRNIKVRWATPHQNFVIVP